ncbi:uncharacterized protein LOC125675541 [Ostrea edulis]|uniref:uncharacterized protein LOC125675541 n=1 Tax=Ostrea edulis TaxID=37623 RepID=UPI0024AEDD29|nr:uncharacterized protein LOC125675541 [Ostrea edulis]XP_056016179.1 uncharacterized protein LOC125675541 [Ostrea edulis]
MSFMTAQSGFWSGYYTQSDIRYPFSIQLFLGNFDGSVKGEGTDNIGNFMINGSWRKLDGSVKFTKQYIGAHSVVYDGLLSPDGRHMDGKYTVGESVGDFHMEISR